MSYNDSPLPEGWIRDFDPSSRHPFWVDTTANPPRAIWVHPFEDELFLKAHPDIRDRLKKEKQSAAPPPYSPRRHSYSGSPSGSHLAVPGRADARMSTSQPGTPAQPAQRGFFGKLKDKAIGTKEEREMRRAEERRREEQYMQRLAEENRRRQQLRMSSPYHQGFPGGPGGLSGGAFGPTSGGFGRPMYAAPAGNPYAQRRTGFGGGGFGGVGLPLLAGAAGGLLLADAFDGPDNYGGYDGGGFDGGGFDGGGFDGGGFDGGGDFGGGDW